MKYFIGLTVTSLLATGAFAHGNMPHGQATTSAQQMMPAEQTPWGIAGPKDKVDREIRLSMTDNMRFTPEKINVKLNETVRFVVDNNGKVLHEFVLGTDSELQKHAQMMKQFPNMVHDEPYMAHVMPAAAGEVIWTFNRPGEFEFACLLPGHFEAGMRGRILVQP